MIEQLEPRHLLSGSLPAQTLLAGGLVPIRWAGQHTFAQPGQWLVTLDRKSGSTRREIADINLALSGKHVRAVRRIGSGDTFLFRGSQLPIDQVRSILQTLSGFQAVEPDTTFFVQATTPNDPNFSSQWGLNQSSDADIDAPEAWSISTGSSSVVTAVVDTGVDYTHPDLAANIWTNPGEIPGNGIDDDGDGYIDDVHGYDFANSDGDPMDDYGHGTDVAGIIAGVGNNGVGITGLNWNGKIMALKFAGSAGWGLTSSAESAVDYADMMKTRYGVNVRVINNSWDGSYSPTLQNAVNQLNIDGILLVAAAGNGGSDQIGDNNDVTPIWPASMSGSNVISVAATDSNDNLAAFSNYGPTTVDLAAPGVNILTTLLGGGYAGVSGTSFAAPFVSGVAAMEFALAPTATLTQIESALLNGVDKISSLNGKVVTGGRLNAFNTLSLLGAGSGLTATYFDNKDLTGTTVTRQDASLNFNWGLNSPSASIGPETFSARWTGKVQAQFSEPYTFYAMADDGVRVWVNGVLLTNRWTDHPATGDLNADGVINALDFNALSANYGRTGAAAAPYDLNLDGMVDSPDFAVLSANFGKPIAPIETSGTITLQANTKYTITVEYFDDTGLASMKLSWSSPSTPKAVVPTNRLFPS